MFPSTSSWKTAGLSVKTKLTVSIGTILCIILTKTVTEVNSCFSIITQVIVREKQIKKQ